MHKSGLQQLTNHVTRAASGLELIHIGTAVRVYARQQRHHSRQLRKVIPVNQNARRARHRHPVNQMVGRATSGQQGDHGVDDAALIHHAADRRKAASLGDGQHAAHGFTCEQLALGVSRVDKGCARHMQAHGFEQHLVAVGRAIESASALIVVSGRFGRQQLLAAHQALRRLLAHLGLGGVRQARGHRPGRHKNRWQMTKMQRTDQEARHDLVAHAQHERGIEHIVRQRNGGALRNGIAAEQRQLHAWSALRHAIAHGRHAASYLGRCAMLAGFVFEDVWVVRQRRMGRQHIVVCSDDADIGRLLLDDANLVRTRQARKGMRHVGTTQALGAGRAGRHLIHHSQIGAARSSTALADAARDRVDGCVKFHVGTS